MKPICSTLAIAIAAIALSACADEGGLRPEAATDFGNSVHQDIAAETVNPDAPEEGATVSANGERAAIAEDRYAKDKVKPPEDPTTSQSSGSGSGSGSNGASTGGGSSGK